MFKLRFFLSISLIAVLVNSAFSQAPANNNCANATTLVLDAMPTCVSNLNATTEPGEPLAQSCLGVAMNQTIWFKFRTGVAGSYTVNTDNNTVDGQIKIYSGTCGSLTEVGCSDDDGTNNTFAAVSTLTLNAATTYYVQADVYGTATGIICINVVYNKPIANDCPLSAIDITTQINEVSDIVPFSCKPYVHGNAAFLPNSENVGGNNTDCDASDLYYDTWFKFTVNANTPKAWLDVYNESQNGEFYYMAVYSGNAAGTCGGNITGLTFFDCSDGDGNLVGNVAIDHVSPNDVAECTTPVVPRLDISSLAPGNYYLRVWQSFESRVAGSINLCAERSTPIGISSDRCLDSANIAKVCGAVANFNVNETYKNLSNAGAKGNACLDASRNEPALAVNGAGMVDEGCTGSPVASLAYANNVINNTVIYRFDINSTLPCQADVTIKFDNIKYGGVPNNIMQVQVMNNACANNSSAIMAATTDQKCMTIRSATGTLANGSYYIMVDGQDGQLIQFDLGIDVKYIGTGCVPTQKPTANFTVENDTVCQNGTAIITYTGNAPNNAIYNWKFAGANIISGTGRGPYTVSWDTAGVKNVNLQVNNSGCLSQIFSFPVLVNGVIADPTVAGAKQICLASPVTLTGNSTGIANPKYRWYSAATGGTLLSSSKTYTTPSIISTTTYYLEVSDGICTSMRTPHTINVGGTLSAPDVLGDTIVCSGASYSKTMVPRLIANAGIAGATYNWYNVATGGTPFYTGDTLVTTAITSDTIFYVMVQTSVACQSPRTRVNIDVVPNPTSTFTLSKNNACANEEIDITYTGTTPAGSIFNWDFDGGFVISGSEAGPYKLVWGEAGAKTITLQVNGPAGTCNSTITSNNITINKAPLGTFLVTRNAICLSDNIDVEYTGDAIAGATYTWDFDGGNASPGTGRGPHNISWATPGIKSIKLTVTENNCPSFENVKNVTVVLITAQNNSRPSSVCTQNGFGIVTPDGGIAPYAYFWEDFPANSDSIIENVGPGTYNVLITDSIGCFLNYLVMVDSFSYPRVLSHTIQNASCNTPNGSNIVTMSSGGGPKAFVFKNMAGDILQSDSNTIDNLGVGIYSVEVTDTNFCVLLDTFTINSSNSNISLEIGPDQTVCPGESYTIIYSPPTGGTAPYAYSWTSITGTERTKANPTVRPTSTTKYILTLSDANLCQAQDSITINVTGNAIITSISGDTIVCEGNSTTLTLNPNNQSNTTISWFDNTSGTLLFTGNPFTTGTLSSSQVYRVSANQTGATCPPTEQIINVTVVNNDLAQAVINCVSSTQNSVIIGWSSVPSADMYEVSEDGGVTFITPNGSGNTHTVMGLKENDTRDFVIRSSRAASSTCPQASSTSSTTTCGTGNAEGYLKFPEIFLPESTEGGETNFVPSSKNIKPNTYKLSVYSRWGELLFESKKEEDYWKGRRDNLGEILPQGVYLYIATAETLNSKKLSVAGTVTLRK